MPDERESDRPLCVPPKDRFEGEEKAEEVVRDSMWKGAVIFVSFVLVLMAIVAACVWHFARDTAAPAPSAPPTFPGTFDRGGR